MVWLLSRDRRSLDILSVKKEAKLSASEISGVEKGKGDGDLRCRSLLAVCQSCLETRVRGAKRKSRRRGPLVNFGNFGPLLRAKFHPART